MTRTEYIDMLRKARAFSASLAAAGDETQELVDAFKVVEQKIAAFQPAKADGSAFTDAELHAAKEAADVGFDNVIERDKPSA